MRHRATINTVTRRCWSSIHLHPRHPHYHH